MKEKNNAMYFYESFADEFDSNMNMYDTNKRLSVIYNELLTEDISGKVLLDAGCGTGWFSKGAKDRGAIVTSMDLGPNLLKQVEKKCETNRIVGSILDIPFDDESFDFVVSSEVIEHTPDPALAIKEIYRVLKPNGIAIITTPNKFWYFSLWIANKFNLRPYQGLENWTSWRKMKYYINDSGFHLHKMVGIHAFPFVFRLFNPILDVLHNLNNLLGPFMVNIAVKVQKP